MVVCSANQQGRQVAKNKGIAQGSAINQEGKQFKPKESQPHNEGGDCLSALERPILKELLAILD